MKKLLSFFPLTKSATDIYHLLAVILVYCAVFFAAGLLKAVIGWLPLLCWLINLVMWLIRVYCFCGIVVVLLDYFKVIK